MRSKVIVWAYLIILSLGTMLSLYMPKTEAAAKDSVVIPGQAIRLRILANSDLDSDQALKRKVRDAVNAQITLWVQDLTSMQKARTVIKEKLPEIKEIAEKVVHDQGSNQTVKVQFGKVQFPTKLYGQYLYPAGEYQAVLITLGKGEGANWWCVLYPPLCFLDFSNGVAVSQGFSEKADAAQNNSGNTDSQDTAAQATDNQSQNTLAAQNTDDQSQNASAAQNTDDQSQSAPAAQNTDNPSQLASADPGINDQPQPDSADSQSDYSVADKQQAGDTNKAGQQTKASKETHNDQSPAKAAYKQQAEDQTITNSANEDADEDQLAVRVASKMEPGGQSATDSASETTADAQPIADKSAKHEKKAPVYTAEDEQPVKVKFFIVELWQKLFD